MRGVMRKQRHRCCVVFRFECLLGAFDTRKRASIKTTQHPWRCFRAHSADRVASLRSATLPCKQRNRDAVYCYRRRNVASHLLYKRWNRDAVCCSKRSCLPFLFIAWGKNNNKYSSINYPLCLQFTLRGRTSRASLHASCLQIIFWHSQSQSSMFRIQTSKSANPKVQCSKFNVQSQPILKVNVQSSNFKTS